MPAANVAPPTPDFSVVIPTYRRPTELFEAATSALAQKGVTVEVIVVDDSPERSAEAVIEKLADARITYASMPRPSGGWPGRVRNVGWPRAKGRIIHFLDDDDVVPRGHYAQALQEFDAHPEVGVIFGRILPFGADERQADEEYRYFQRASERARSCQRLGQWAFAARQYFESTLLVCSAALIRRECVAALGGFDPEVRLVEDATFFARAFREFGVHYTDRVTLHYRIGPSLMRSKYDPKEFMHSYHRAHASYRAQHGPLEFLAMKALAQTAMRAL